MNPPVHLCLLLIITLILDPLRLIEPAQSAVPFQRPFNQDGRIGRTDEPFFEGRRGGAGAGAGVGGDVKGMREHPYLRAHREQFSAIDNDPSQSLYDRFHKIAYSNFSSSSSDGDDKKSKQEHRSTPTSFTMTQDPTFLLIPFARDPAHVPFIHVREIKSSNKVERGAGRTVFKQVGRRRDGVGMVGEVRDLVGWGVEWRGLKFEVWQSMYFDTTTYRYITQSHILGFSHPDLFPYTLPSPGLDLILTAGLKVNTTQKGPIDVLWTPEEAADLLILEVGVWSTKVGESILVFDNGWWEKDHKLWESVQKADWKDVILPPVLQRSVRHEYASFFSSESIYKDLGVAWKRGVIFLGPPGNGKTISVKAMMRDVLLGLGGVGKEEEKRVLYVRSFHTPWGDEHGISEIFSRARKEAPCLVVFEDIDSLVNDDNRSFFLNEVDGLEDNDGLLMLATTNHFDRLDPALSNRPSRFDRKYNFPDPVKHERRQYALYWQDKLKENDRVEFPDSLLDEFAGKTEGFSFAYMKEAFVSALLILAGDESNDKTFPTELMSQVKALREELDSDKLRVAEQESMTRSFRPESEGECILLSKTTL